MKPTQFEHANATLGGGPSSRYGTTEDVADLPVWRGPGHVVSCWSMTWRERFRCLLTGRVWLHVAASNHPPVVLDVADPFAEDSK